MTATAVMRLRSFLQARASSSLVPLIDQGFVSGFGFLIGVIAAHTVDLVSFGRFSIAIIFSAFAQNMHNALITSPMMSSVGQRGRVTNAYGVSLIGFAAVASIVAGPLAGGLLGGFFALREGGFPFGLAAATAVLTGSQNMILTLRRLLFACAQGTRAVVMDGARAVAFPVALLLAHAAGLPNTVDVLIGVLGLTGLLVAILFALPFRPQGPLLRVLHPWAIARRHGPLARWLMWVVMVTFGQEQLLWIGAGFVLGDTAMGGLRGAQYLVGFVLIMLAATENVVPLGAARAYAEAGPSGLTRYLYRTGLELGLLVSALVLAVALPAPFWLTVIFGAEFVPFASCVRILALAAVFVHVRDMTTQYFRATLRTAPILRAFVFSLIVSLACLYPLLQGAGLNGAAWTVLIGHAASAAYMLLAASGYEPWREAGAAEARP